MDTLLLCRKENATIPWVTSAVSASVQATDGRVDAISFGSGQDHQAGKPCAARAVAEGRTGHIVGCLDYETLGRRQVTSSIVAIWSRE